jgi:hypothetical protein
MTLMVPLLVAVILQIGVRKTPGLRKMAAAAAAAVGSVAAAIKGGKIAH